ncbi:MAG: hypothetical protein ACFCUI_04405 [Bernardetiaceae bacterium]
MRIPQNTYRITYEHPNNYLEVVVRGFLTFEKYKECWTQVLDLLEVKACTALLIDLSEAQVISLESQRWLQEVYFPRMYALPQFEELKVVRVLSEDVFIQISIENIDRNREHDQDTFPKYAKDFHSRDEALGWLLSS